MSEVVTKEVSRSRRGENETDANISKFITFYIEKELMGIDILRVLEIYPTPEITIVPNAPDYIKGVINLRGKVIPVISLRSKFKLPQRPLDADTKIIVVKDETDNEVGIIVDRNWIVIPIENSIIEPPPATMGEIEGEFLKGVAQLESKQLLIILNLKRVLDKED
jgi:purine-binding chemotaxis protein CheW